MKTPEEILELNFYKPKETLKYYDNIITIMEDYANQFKQFVCAKKCTKQCFSCSQEKFDLKTFNK